MDLHDKRIVVPLRHALLEQPHDDLSIFGIVLIPGVEDRLAQSSSGYRGYKNDVKTLGYEAEGDRAMVIGGRFYCDTAWCSARPQESDQAVIVISLMHEAKSLLPAISMFHQCHVYPFGNVDRDPG